jgi:hypothetical protein
MKLKGKVEHRDLEGGIFQLVTDGGERYTLAGAPADLKRAKGSRVEVEGSVDEGAVGFAMAGPTLRVKSFKLL